MQYLVRYHAPWQRRDQGGHGLTLFLKSYFPRDVFLEIGFCVILQGIQNFFGPVTPRSSLGPLDIIFDALQGSILGPLLFNAFLADYFFVVIDIDIASYADDNTVVMRMILSHLLSKHPMPCLKGFKPIFWKLMLTNVICWLVQMTVKVSM